jgi:tripartite-type tricarboxylate transporter receptor subunit TctC
MSVTRRNLLLAGALSAPALLLGRRALAKFPEKDIAFVIPDSAGGGFDSYVRALSPAIEKQLPAKVNVVPTNVPGAGGARAAAELYRARPDGAMIGIFNVPGIYVQRARGASGFDLAKFSWLGRVGEDHYGLAVAAASPIKSIADLQTLSKTRAVKFTSTGPAGTAYSATLIACNLLGIKPQLITGYKGSNDYVVGAIRGDGDAVVTTLPLLKRLAAGNTLRIIATFETHSTVPGSEDASTLRQPELAQIALERLVAGPPNLPADAKAALADAIARSLADPDVVAWAKKSDTDLSPATPDQAAKIVSDQAAFMEKWHQVLSAS